MISPLSIQGWLISNGFYRCRTRRSLRPPRRHRGGIVSRLCNLRTRPLPLAVRTFAHE